MPDPQMLRTPGQYWTEDATITNPRTQANLRRWGSAREACRILDDCDVKLLYELIARGDIAAYKRRPHASNSHWRVDLLSVWKFKQSQIAASCGCRAIE